MRNKYIFYLLIAICIPILISCIYIFFPNLPNSIDNSIRDNMFKMRGEIKPKSDSVVIIDIDEKSISKLGQWPWSRDILSKILENLTISNIGVIAFDIVFSEEDRTSPHKFFQKLNIKQKNPVNYDKEFAKIIANSPTILGYQFELSNKEYLKKTIPIKKAIFIEKNKNKNNDNSIKASGTILNIPILRNSAYSSGFFNNIPDDSGIIRSVPLVISYENQLYPSLVLEIIRIALQTNDIFLNYDENGIENIRLSELIIPTDRYGRMLINYRGKEKSFKYISALDIYNNNFNKEDIKNKIALIGTSAAALLDLRATPFESIFPGVEVHANAIDNILSQDFLYKESWINGVNISIIFILSIFCFFFVRIVPILLTPLLTFLLILLTLYALYNILFDYGLVLNMFFPIISILTSIIISLILEYFYESKKKEEIKSKFASKVSPAVMEELLKNHESDQLKSENREITVFFSDIRKFTNISESIGEPEKIIQYLNDYMVPMSGNIIENKGTIDKYIGDAIMAYWNAPFEIKNHADLAIKSSLEQKELLIQLNKTLLDLNKPEIKIGIGITTGLVTIGELGSKGRSDYTIIGDVVNLGSRVESLCPFYGGEIIITEYTKNMLNQKYFFRYLDYIRVKGKNEAVKLWEVIGKYDDTNEVLIQELHLYDEALKLYHDKKLQEALNIFEKLYKQNNNCKIYDIYIQRCDDFIRNNYFEEIYTHYNK